MKKIMVLAMTALLVTGASGAAFARGGNVDLNGATFRHGSQSGFHGNRNFNGNHNYHGGYRHYGHYRGYGGVYGDDSDDFVGPFVAGGIFGAVLGNVLNR